MLGSRVKLGLTVNSSLLGAAEAGFYPGIVLYFTYWFTSKHQARAVAIFITGVAIASIFGNPLSGWLLDNVHWLGMPAWRWLFMQDSQDRRCVSWSR